MFHHKLYMEVNKNLSWPFFCHVGSDSWVPTCLIHLSKRASRCFESRPTRMTGFLFCLLLGLFLILLFISPPHMETE
ncbi:hypothetical protein CARUB_v10018853mg [Capsella rubella]|uniref:Uncharacterized protein n=1 Tax=Capsella rubella TaxID=81985 RepID=R0HJY9_9BRAS|nr:hypothetical protein CARUB_v10018853mg [Capsella rubella]